MWNYARKGRVLESPTSTQFGFVARWASTMHGNGDVAETLETLLKLLRADAVKLVRCRQQRPAPQIIAKADTEAGRFLRPTGREVLADIMLDGCGGHLQRGSSWTLSERLSDDGDGFAHTPEFVRRCAEQVALREALIIVLDSDDSMADLIEIHFRSVPHSHNLQLATILGPTLSDCWRARNEGLVRALTSQRRMRLVTGKCPEPRQDILDANNPSNLSRSEFRVCLMLRDGLRVKSIAKELSVCNATIRSHLSSIYSKLGISSQVELLHRMNISNSPQLASGGHAPHAR